MHRRFFQVARALCLISILFAVMKGFSQAPLREGTPVKLKLLHRLDSKVVVVDDPVNFVVAEDLIQDGEVVIPAGAVAIGRVRIAKPARTLGRGAQLGLEIQYAKVGTTRIPLRGTALKSGEGKQAETVAIVVLFGVSGLIKHGSEIEIPEGEIFNAYVDQDVAVILKKPGMQTQSGE